MASIIFSRVSFEQQWIGSFARLDVQNINFKFNEIEKLPCAFIIIAMSHFFSEILMVTYYIRSK